MLRHAPESGLGRAWVGVCRMQAVAQSAYKRQSEVQKADRSVCVADVHIHVSREQLAQGVSTGALCPHMLANQAKSLQGGKCRRVDMAQESRSPVGREGGWWTAVCLLSLAQCGWAL